MRSLPNFDTVPASVYKYLLPHEECVVIVRQHPGMLIPAASTAVGASLASLAVSIVHSGPVAAKYIVWFVTLFLILRFLDSLRRWATSYIVVTNFRFMLISSKIAASPLADLRILVIETSGFGKLGYGAFRIGPDGPNQLVIDYIPNPDKIQFQVNDLLYPSAEESW
jgi:hypothetical protein